MNRSLISIGELLEAKASVPVAEEAAITQDKPKLAPIRPADTRRETAKFPGVGSDKLVSSENKPDSVRSQYFVDQAFLLYGKGDVLLDRQVVPFADMQRFELLNVFSHVRHHVLMEAEGEAPGRVVTCGSKNGEVFAQTRLHDRSYRCICWAESAAGFLGNDAVVWHGPRWETIAPYKSMGNWSVFQDQGIECMAQIFPQFYAKVGSPGKDQDAWQMVDVTTGIADWYCPLRAFFPLAVASSRNWTSDQIKEIEIRLHQEFLFNRIYIGMSSVGPVSWKPLGGHRVGPRQLDPESPYFRSLHQPLSLADLGHAATSLDLAISEFFIPTPAHPSHIRWDLRDKRQVESDVAIQDMLNDTAQRMFCKIMGRADVPTGMLEKSTP